MNSSVSAPSASRKYSATVESGQRNPQARPRRLRHLTIDECGLRLGRLAGLDHAGFRHLQPEVVALAGALAHAGKYGVAAVLLGYVVDQFHDDDGLAYARAAEQTDLAALQERLNKIDDLHAGLKHFRCRGLFVESRRQSMNRHSLLVLDRTKLVDRVADHIHDASQRATAHGHGDRSVLVDGFHAAHHTIGGRHGDAAHASFAQMLLHFENHVDGAGHGKTVADHPHRFINRRQLAFGKLHVHRRARNLNYMSYVFCHMF